MSNYNKLIDRFDRLFFYFLNKFINSSTKPLKKFYIDIVYGILKSKSIVLSNVTHALNEKITPRKTIQRLTNFLDSQIDLSIYSLYLKKCISMMSSPMKMFIVDDTDVVKPYGKTFEALGTVRDASAINTTFEKGYRVTTIIGLTDKSKHPLPLYDVFHSESQKGFNSVNEYTMKGLNSVINLLKPYEGIFAFDRGYDDNKLIKFFNENKQYFLIRLTKRRKIIIKGQKNSLIDIGCKKKGKIVIPVTYKGSRLQAKASHLKIKLIGFKETYYIIFSYLDKASKPLMLLTNKPIGSKNDVINAVMNYCSRWKIEEYFRFKKVEFNFENFRVRTLNKINHLAFCLDIAISFMTYLIENKSDLYYKLLGISKRLRGNESYLKFYQLISGINVLLGHKEKGIKTKQKIEHRDKLKQLTLF